VHHMSCSNPTPEKGMKQVSQATASPSGVIAELLPIPWSLAVSSHVRPYPPSQGQCESSDLVVVGRHNLSVLIRPCAHGNHNVGRTVKTFHQAVDEEVLLKILREFPQENREETQTMSLESNGTSMRRRRSDVDREDFVLAVWRKLCALVKHAQSYCPWKFRPCSLAMPS